MEKRQKYVEEEPEAALIFDTLENHWPKLVNAMGSKVIPKTNNAVELVIRRFDTKPSVVLILSRRFGATWRFSSWSTASRRSPNTTTLWN